MKLIRVIVLEGPPDWIEAEKSRMSLYPGSKWNVSAAVSEGGGGTMKETFRGTEAEFLKAIGMDNPENAYKIEEEQPDDNTPEEELCDLY